MPRHTGRPITPTAALTIAAPVLFGLFLAMPGLAREGALLTPLILAVENAPVPFRGSDGNTHLVYELFVTNFSSGSAAVEGVEIFVRRHRAGAA